MCPRTLLMHPSLRVCVSTCPVHTVCVSTWRSLWCVRVICFNARRSLPARRWSSEQRAATSDRGGASRVMHHASDGFLTGKRASCAFPRRSSNAAFSAMAVLIVSAYFTASSLLVHPGPRHKSDFRSTLPLYNITSPLPLDDDTVNASKSTIPQTLWDQCGCKCPPRPCSCDTRRSCCASHPPSSSTWRPTLPSMALSPPRPSSISPPAT